MPSVRRSQVNNGVMKRTTGRGVDMLEKIKSQREWRDEGARNELAIILATAGSIKSGGR